MVTIQIQGTPQEVRDVLQLFYVLHSKGLCSIGNYEEHCVNPMLTSVHND